MLCVQETYIFTAYTGLGLGQYWLTTLRTSHQSVGMGGMCPMVLKEAVDIVAKSLSIVFENSWCSGEDPTDWENETWLQFL